MRLMLRRKAPWAQPPVKAPGHEDSHRRDETYEMVHNRMRNRIEASRSHEKLARR